MGVWFCDSQLVESVPRTGGTSSFKGFFTSTSSAYLTLFSGVDSFLSDAALISVLIRISTIVFITSFQIKKLINREEMSLNNRGSVNANEWAKKR